MTETQNVSPAQQEERLPCRGCQPNCPHYEGCNGKPWRMDAGIVVPRIINQQ